MNKNKRKREHFELLFKENKSDSVAMVKEKEKKKSIKRPACKYHNTTAPHHFNTNVTDKGTFNVKINCSSSSLTKNI